MAVPRNIDEQWRLRRAIRAIQRAVDEIGVITREGSLKDATFVKVPRQRNKKEENDAIKTHETPEGWEEKPHKLAQKDLDACWAKKGAQTFFGYKNHIKMDKDIEIAADDAPVVALTDIPAGAEIVFGAGCATAAGGTAKEAGTAPEGGETDDAAEDTTDADAGAEDDGSNAGATATTDGATAYAPGGKPMNGAMSNGGEGDGENPGGDAGSADCEPAQTESEPEGGATDAPSGAQGE